MTRGVVGSELPGQTRIAGGPVRALVFDRRLESQREISSYRVLRFCSHMRMCMHKQKRQIGVLLAQI